jgi:hypothetical protein
MAWVSLSSFNHFRRVSTEIPNTWAISVSVNSKSAKMQRCANYQIPKRVRQKDRWLDPSPARQLTDTLSRKGRRLGNERR